MSKFLIIDGNSLAFRAFYALPNLTTRTGTPTGCVYGFLNMFLKVLEEYKPSHVAVAFDFSRYTFRNEIFADYKGTRSETPLDLRTQFPILKELLKLMNLKVIEMKNIEADDIIGSLAKQISGEKIILSGDKDVLQLIDNDCHVWLTKKGITEIQKVNLEVLKNEFLLTPAQVIELKALMGDNSDNIPGVNGVGPKTATNLILKYDNIENLYKSIETADISEKLKNKLLAEKEIAFMSKTLATIKTDVDVSANLEDYKLSLPFSGEVSEFIRNLDMPSLLKRSAFFDALPEEKVNITPLTKINSLSQLKDVVAGQVQAFAFNMQEDLKFAVNDSETFIIETELSLFNIPLDISQCLEILRPLFESSSIKKILYNYKTTKHFLEDNNISINGEVFDINLANYLVNFDNIPQDSVESFFSLENILKTKLKAINMEKLYHEIELPLEDLLYEMEQTGFKVDKAELALFSEKINKELEKTVSFIFKMACGNFNINSPKQLAEVLFDKLKLPTINNPKQSTGVEVLEELIDYHPIISEILRYRKLQKLKTTYVDVFLKLADKNPENIIHTSYNQTLTATGRLSSTNPNLQNIPVHDDDGKELRKVFVSRFSNGCLVSADYNQIELRLLAHFSADENLINAFNSNQDIHALTASKIFGKPIQQITPEERRSAKAVNFGIVYGISNFGLSQNIKISREEAQRYLNEFFELYPRIKTYMDENVDFAQKYGYVKTLFDRRRYIKELSSQNYQERQFGKRVAMNMPLQGTASDIIKISMLKVNKKLKELNLESKIILQIHDELVLDCPQNETATVANILKTEMETVVDLAVKLPVAVSVGKSFFEV